MSTLKCVEHGYKIIYNAVHILGKKKEQIFFLNSVKNYEEQEALYREI